MSDPTVFLRDCRMLRSLFPIDVDQQFDLKITIQLHDPHLFSQQNEWIVREECAVDEDVVKPKFHHDHFVPKNSTVIL